MEETIHAPAPRIPLQLEISFKRNYAREADTGIVTNISLTGAFMKSTKTILRTNEKLNLILIVAGRKRKISANVVWTNNFGAGIQFLPQNNRDVQIVDDLMYFVEYERIETRSVMNSIFKKMA